MPFVTLRHETMRTGAAPAVPTAVNLPMLVETSQGAGSSSPSPATDASLRNVIHVRKARKKTGAGITEIAKRPGGFEFTNTTKRFVTPTGAAMTAIRDVNLVVEPGQFCAIVGQTMIAALKFGKAVCGITGQPTGSGCGRLCRFHNIDLQALGKYTKSVV